MQGRCRIKTHTSFEYYGGLGIGICEEWEDFYTFRAWALANGYQEKLSIDRLDSTKGYFPSNCRWIPRSRQSENKRKSGSVLPRRQVSPQN